MPRRNVGQYAVLVGAVWLLCVTGRAGSSAASDVPGDAPLYERIDRWITAGTTGYDELAAPLTSDAEFLRRATLDLTGTIPTVDEVRAFLNSGDDPAKRAECVDRLLASPGYARRMQRAFDVLLMRRLPASNVKAAEWQAFLRTAFAENRPWDQITREILSADGTDAEHRGPARFYLDRSGDMHEITRDVARIFLGANLDCAQCHDHPAVDDWKQKHYYGIAAFLVRTSVFTGKDKTSVLAEKADGEVSFESVFEIRDKISSGPKSIKPTLFTGPALDEPQLSGDEAYEVKPAEGVRAIPKFSRRAHLAEMLTSPENRRFARTAANRLWELMLGRGLVEPVDEDHSGNPPSHPELLDELTDEFIASGYDVRRLLREIALSRTYQRSSRLSDGEAEQPVDESAFARAILKPLGPSQLARALLEATGETQRQRRALGDEVTADALDAKLAGHESKFESVFGGVPGKWPEGFQATVEQALFLANSPGVLELLEPKDENLAARLLAIPVGETQPLADELYLSVLSRYPNADDYHDVDAFLTGATSETRAAVIGELIWALTASGEFRFNH